MNWYKVIIFANKKSLMFAFNNFNIKTDIYKNQDTIIN